MTIFGSQHSVATSLRRCFVRVATLFQHCIVAAGVAPKSSRLDPGEEAGRGCVTLP